MLRIHVVTLFPDMLAPFVDLSIVGRARRAGLVSVELHGLFGVLGERERPDDRPYGGGPGMVLRVEPIATVLDAILAGAPDGERRRILVTAPTGRLFCQGDAVAFAGLDRLIVVCGHYEGIDERLIELYGAEELSLGEFVLTGGEIPAAAFLDATIRQIPGAINADSLASESFAGAGADHPAYTRPPVFRGAAVPEVLLSGDHARIADWRAAEARRRDDRRL
jgi:tRNA (guanine37-N1)-methyltransferase